MKRSEEEENHRLQVKRVIAANIYTIRDFLGYFLDLERKKIFSTKG